jgi:hypothetical protein
MKPEEARREEQEEKRIQSQKRMEKVNENLRKTKKESEEMLQALHLSLDELKAAIAARQQRGTKRSRLDQTTETELEASSEPASTSSSEPASETPVKRKNWRDAATVSM